MKQSQMFGSRATLEESLAMTARSLCAHGPEHDTWAVSWSGGKDSTATLTVLLHLLDTDQVPRPRSLRVLYADTRQELPPLYAAAIGTIDRLGER